MLIRRVWSLAALLLTLVLTGCPPAPEGRTNEQKNRFYLTGKERLQSFDYKGAIEAFERALEDNPKFPLTHFELGLIYEQHEADYPAALYHYNKALKLRPSGYPADTIRQRIPGCRQELVKADSLTVLNPSGLRDIERLREENQELRQQILALQSSLPAARSMAPGSAGGSPGLGTPVSLTGNGPRSTSPYSPSTATVSSLPRAIGPSVTNRASGNPGAGSRTSPESTRVRYHTVRAGETLAAISRKYNVRLDALLSLNPGLEPRKMKVGQTIRVPAS